jgi:hypothetical protein
MNSQDYSKLQRVVAATNAERELAKQRYQEDSTRRLCKIIKTKCTTIFIGDLSQIEQNLGFLWGYGKNESELTEEELQMRAIWEKIRNAILNNGNNQIRALENELNQYSVNWNRYKYVSNINKEEE